MHGLCKAHVRELDWRWPCGVQYLAMVMESNNTYPYPRVASHWSKVSDKTHGYLECLITSCQKKVKLVGREPSIQSQKELKDSVRDYNLLSQHLGSLSTSILSNISISPVRFIVLISHQLHPELHFLQSPPVSNQKRNQRPSLLTIRTYLNNLNHHL